MLTADTVRGALIELGEFLIEAARAYLMTTGRYPLKMRNSRLLKSMTTKVAQGRNARGQFGTFDASGLSVFVEDYAKYVISGRRPFARKVPISALIGWIKLKGVGSGRDSRGRFAGRPADINRLAWAIQASIYKNGIKGRDFVTVAIRQGEQVFDAWLDTRALDAITKDLDNVFKFGK